MGIALAENRYFISLRDCMRLSAHTEQLKANSTFCSALVHRRFFFAITHWHRPHILPRITEGTHRNSCTLRSIYCSLSLNKNNNSSAQSIVHKRLFAISLDTLPYRSALQQCISRMDGQFVYCSCRYLLPIRNALHIVCRLGLKTLLSQQAADDRKMNRLHLFESRRKMQRGENDVETEFYSHNIWEY